MLWVVIVAVIVLVGVVAAYDLVQRKHAILRNFPVVGHLRYLLEGIGPELRQYIVTDNDSDRPFSRDQRRWVYTSAKRVNSYIGYGTDNDLERTPGYVIVRPQAFPLNDPVPDGAPLPCAKVLGAARKRARAFRMSSAVNISSMSYGSLGARAVEALNGGAALAGCLQGTGEGGLTPYHQRGGELVWQIGTGYYGCRDAQGRFDLERFCEVVAVNPTIRAIDIKLSQGAKPGLGGVLPAAKVTREIAEMRGVPLDADCISPPAHSAFHDVDSMLDFVELLADRTGLPIGVKTAVGDLRFFEELARLMADTDRGIDFLTVDGGEGGTGAAPLAFADHVALPFKV
ncbi:MAG: glutamate synthase-related protein, partial [Acidimicrobiia bacterium]